MSQWNRAFLTSLAALSPSGDNGRIKAEAVNQLGSALGLDGPAVLAVVEAMKEEGLINLYWMPELSLTDKGRRRAAGEPDASAVVTVHAGGTYVGGSVGVGANVGTGAGAFGGTIAVSSVVTGVPASLLAAALIQLQDAKLSLPEKAHAPAAALEKELKETTAAAIEAGQKSESADSNTLARVGERIKRSTELLGQVEQAGGKLANVGGLLKNAWDAVAPHLPTIGS